LYAALFFSGLGPEILESEGTNQMSFDIRRCSREDLDRINAEAKAWRERGNKHPQEPLPEPIRAESPAEMQDSMQEVVQPVQLNLF
jgi:hypothetical protein